jgi:hypothetical protein
VGSMVGRLNCRLRNSVDRDVLFQWHEENISAIGVQIYLGFFAKNPRYTSFTSTGNF